MTKKEFKKTFVTTKEKNGYMVRDDPGHRTHGNGTVRTHANMVVKFIV